MHIREIRDYLKDLTEDIAVAFVTKDSEVTVNASKHNRRAGYADCEIYSASVTAPDLEKLPKGYKDALERLDTRFRIDTAFKFLNLEYPDLYRDMRNHINEVGQAENRLSVNEIYVKLDEERDAQKAYASAGVDDPAAREKLHADFRKLNMQIGEVWETVRNFVAENGDKYQKDPKGKPIFKEMMRNIEENRPQKRDTYDVFLQTLMEPETGGQPFGLVLCDGISSHYMSANEARNIKRDSPNSFLDKAEAGIDKLFRMTKSVICGLGHSWMGEIPKDKDALKAIEKELIVNSYPEIDKEDIERLLSSRTAEEQEETSFAPS